METSAINPSSVPEATGGYVNGLEVRGAGRMLFVSGQIPQDREGRVPEGIEAQCRLVWSNLTAVLGAADMDVTNLVKGHYLSLGSHLCRCQLHGAPGGPGSPPSGLDGGHHRDMGPGLADRDRGDRGRLSHLWQPS